MPAGRSTVRRSRFALLGPDVHPARAQAEQPMRSVDVVLTRIGPPVPAVFRLEAGRPAVAIGRGGRGRAGGGG